MPRTPLVAARAALRSAVEATVEAERQRRLSSEGHGRAQAGGRSADRNPVRATARTQCIVRSRFVT